MITTILPSYTVGAGACAALGQVCAGSGARVLLPIGGKTALAKVLPSLTAAAASGGLTLLDPVWYGGGCTAANIRAAAHGPQASCAQAVLGIGGGKAIDTAKGAADLLGLPLVTVPTISATCAAVTALSVVYHEDGSFEGFRFYDRPPAHALIDLELIVHAPAQYLRAGMGDALAKHFEAAMSAQGDHPPYHSTLGLAVSASCKGPVLEYGLQALADCRAGQATPALEQAVLASIVSTGLVSLLVEEDYNGGVAHSLFYGLTLLPHIEEDHLHGDVVAYGVLVQLALEGREEELGAMAAFLKALGCPTCLKDLGLSPCLPQLEPALRDAVTQSDMAHLPLRVTPQLLWEAILRVEALNE